jgi:hypothetical protein
LLRPYICRGIRFTGLLSYRIRRISGLLRPAEFGNKSRAHDVTAAALDSSSRPDIELLAALALARLGDQSQASALAGKLERNFDRDTMIQVYWLPTIRAAIEIDRGNGQRAGGLEAAIEFQKIIDHRGIVANSPLGVVAHLQLARAYWFLQLMEELGVECWVGHPAKIRAYEPRKQKNDLRDARLLCRLLTHDIFPRIWVPSVEQRDVRALLMHRHQWVRMRARIQNAL